MLFRSVSPEKFLGSGSETFSNQFPSAVRKSGTLVHVDSPSLESQRWLRSQISRGADLVDVELQKIATEARRQNSSLSGYLVISDELNSPHPVDYTLWSESHREQSKRALRPIINHHLREAGIQPGTGIRNYRLENFVATEGAQGP